MEGNDGALTYIYLRRDTRRARNVAIRACIVCRDTDLKEGVDHFKAQGYAIFGTARETGSYVTVLPTEGDGYYPVLSYHKRYTKKVLIFTSKGRVNRSWTKIYRTSLN